MFNYISLVFAFGFINSVVISEPVGIFENLEQELSNWCSEARDTLAAKIKNTGWMGNEIKNLFQDVIDENNSNKLKKGTTMISKDSFSNRLSSYLHQTKITLAVNNDYGFFTSCEIYDILSDVYRNIETRLSSIREKTRRQIGKNQQSDRGPEISMKQITMQTINCPVTRKLYVVRDYFFDKSYRLNKS